MALVLGEDGDPPELPVDEVREREVDQAVVPAEGHRRLGPVLGERPQPLPLTAGEDEREAASGRHSA